MPKWSANTTPLKGSRESEVAHVQGLLAMELAGRLSNPAFFGNFAPLSGADSAGKEAHAWRNPRLDVADGDGWGVAAGLFGGGVQIGKRDVGDPAGVEVEDSGVLGL